MGEEPIIYKFRFSTKKVSNLPIWVIRYSSRISTYLFKGKLERKNWLFWFCWTIFSFVGTVGVFKIGLFLWEIEYFIFPRYYLPPGKRCKSLFINTLPQFTTTSGPEALVRNSGKKLFLFWLVWYRYLRQYACSTMIFIWTEKFKPQVIQNNLFCFGMKQLEKKQFHLFCHFYWLNASNSLIPVGRWLKFVQS